MVQRSGSCKILRHTEPERVSFGKIVAALPIAEIAGLTVQLRHSLRWALRVSAVFAEVRRHAGRGHQLGGLCRPRFDGLLRGAGALRSFSDTHHSGDARDDGHEHTKGSGYDQTPAPTLLFRNFLPLLRRQVSFDLLTKRAYFRKRIARLRPVFVIPQRKQRALRQVAPARTLNRRYHPAMGNTDMRRRPSALRDDRRALVPRRRDLSRRDRPAAEAKAEIG